MWGNIDVIAKLRCTHPCSLPDIESFLSIPSALRSRGLQVQTLNSLVMHCYHMKHFYWGYTMLQFHPLKQVTSMPFQPVYLLLMHWSTGHLHFVKSSNIFWCLSTGEDCFIGAEPRCGTRTAGLLGAVKDRQTLLPLIKGTNMLHRNRTCAEDQFTLYTFCLSILTASPKLWGSWG